MRVVEILLAVAVIVGGWQVHVRFFPWKPCPRCGGAKRIRSGSAHRDCGRCGSEGRVRRWGAGKES
jgi:DnaJ-class molecular chaperone